MSVTGFQLADFAASCSLPRSLVQATLTALCKQVVEQLPRVWAACVLQTAAEQEFAANLRDSIQQQTSRLLEHARIMQAVEI